MKMTNAFGVFPCLALCLLLPLFARAREGAPLLRYKFSTGQTNVYHVEIEVRSEVGLETTTGNVFIVPTQVASNVIRLSCRGNLEVKREAQRILGYYGNMYPRGTVSLPDGCEIQIDDRGRVLRDSGDYPLSAPLGELIRSLIEPLPASAASHWETSDEVVIMDSPMSLGPALAFFSPETYGPPFFLNFNPRPKIAVLTMMRHTKWQVTAVTPETVAIHKQLALESLLHTGAEPRGSADGEGDLVFDHAAGLFKKIEMQGNDSALTETTVRKARVSFKCRLLEGAELAAAFAPPPASPPLRKLINDELQQITADLKSGNPEARRNAATRLSNAELDSPPPELLNLMASLLSDNDYSISQAAVNFLGKYGAKEQVPLLAKLLQNSDWGKRQTAIKALVRLKDERAIEPLADAVARGQSGPDAVSALVGFGSAAEKSALQLFNEKNFETRRQACGVLQQIGTETSIETLQKTVGDPDQSLSQAAADAIRVIKSRQ
jgi:hypothetical protein